MNLYDIARRYFGAFANKDTTALQELLDENVYLRDWTIDIGGRNAVVAEMERGFRAFARIVVEPVHVYSDGQFVLAELVITLDGEQIKVLDVLQFNQQSKIVAIRAYKG
jgi:ketosteroid isomerase-like protein